ncbi:MAG TPA: hypothetical protein VFH56_10325 [Acidimicrobiales bacterium]|nr:hypothetical protein [Acidimicrobiales bacterium]
MNAAKIGLAMWMILFGILGALVMGVVVWAIFGTTITIIALILLTLILWAGTRKRPPTRR